MLAKHPRDLRSEILIFVMLEFLTSDSNHLCALALEEYLCALPMFLSFQRLYFGRSRADQFDPRSVFASVDDTVGNWPVAVVEGALG